MISPRFITRFLFAGLAAHSFLFARVAYISLSKIPNQDTEGIDYVIVGCIERMRSVQLAFELERDMMILIRPK